MSQSLTRLYAHLVFSTKNRDPLLDEAISGLAFMVTWRRPFVILTLLGWLSAVSRTTFIYYLILARWSPR